MHLFFVKFSISKQMFVTKEKISKRNTRCRKRHVEKARALKSEIRGY